MNCSGVETKGVEQMHCEDLDCILIKNSTNQQTTALKDILGMIGKLSMYWMICDIMELLLIFLGVMVESCLCRRVPVFLGAAYWSIYR